MQSCIKSQRRDSLPKRKVPKWTFPKSNLSYGNGAITKTVVPPFPTKGLVILICFKANFVDSNFGWTNVQSERLMIIGQSDARIEVRQEAHISTITLTNEVRSLVIVFPCGDHAGEKTRERQITGTNNHASEESREQRITRAKNHASTRNKAHK